VSNDPRPSPMIWYLTCLLAYLTALPPSPMERLTALMQTARKRADISDLLMAEADALMGVLAYRAAHLEHVTATIGYIAVSSEAPNIPSAS